MNSPFGAKLKEKMDIAGLKAAELARRSGVTKQNIGRILNNTPHSITRALPKVERPTIEKLAKALDWDLDEALITGGYAPQSETIIKKPTNPAEFFDALDKLGLDIQFDGGRKVLIGLDEDDLQELLDSVVANAIGKSKRKKFGLEKHA